MSTVNLMNEINSRIASGEDVSQNKQLKTALNQLIKYELINDSNIDEIFNAEEKLSEVIDVLYLNAIIKDGKKERRTPLTHARNLASFYVAFFTFDASDMTFPEAFRAAIHRKYDNVYEGKLDPKDKKNRAEIKSKYKTYREIALEMVTSGFKISPHLWPGLTAGSVSLIVRYMRGASLPSVRIPIERIEFFEDFLAIPRGSLTKKLTLLDRGLYEKEPKKVKKKDRPKRPDALCLSPELQRYADEYSEYRVTGKQPKILFVPQELIGKEQHLRVVEIYKNKWRVRKRTGKVTSKGIFIQQLRAFSNFCIKELGMEPNAITLEHLTTIDILEKWKTSVIEKGRGGHAVEKLFHYIKKSVGYRGYLRLCGTPGSRSIDEYNAELNLLPSLIEEWTSFLEDGIDSKDSKEHIRFLLDMTINDMWNAIDNAIQAAFDYAAKVIMHPIPSHAEFAYQRTEALTILHLSRVAPIRESNWTDLEFNENSSDFSYDVPSITWYKSKNCYRLHVPVNLLKNQQREGILPISCYYLESYNDIIKKHLFYRQKYIDVVINENGRFNHKPKTFIIKDYHDKSGQENNNKFECAPGVFGTRFKTGTCKSFSESLPGYDEKGINHHATRHLAATWYLNEHPDDWTGLSKLLNDSIEVVHKDYAEVNEALAQERINESVEKRNRVFKF